MQKDHMSANSQPVTTALPFPRTSERLLNSREVAEWLGVSIDWVQAHATRRNPRIPAVCLGTGRNGRQMLRFRRPDIESFISEHMQSPSSLRRRA
jgi:predicted DNA-binding transcriptional regulator AlpA